MGLELFKKGTRRILEDYKNPGESWKLTGNENIYATSRPKTKNLF